LNRRHGFPGATTALDLNPQSVEVQNIQVRLKLYGSLRRHRPDGLEGSSRQPFEMQVPHGSTVADLLSVLNIGQGFVAAVAINGQAANMESSLHEGDEIRLFPPSAGG